MSGTYNKRLLIAKCALKYPRGINFVHVTEEQLGETFTPNFFIDPGRYFLTFDRLFADALKMENKEELKNTEFMKMVKQKIDSYDPTKILLFLMACQNGEFYLYEIDATIE